MKWEGREGSGNIEDRRGSGGRKAAVGGGLAIIILIVGLLFGGDPQKLLNNLTQGSEPATEQTTGEIKQSEEEKKLSQFVSVVLRDNEKIWTKIFSENGMQYEAPVLVLFRGSTNSPCGDATTESGPFYCPADQKIYLDLNFFDELTHKLGAHGDFAMAYVIAHEVAHHVQHLLGTTRKVREKQERTNEKGANRLSVALELQADFMAGVWAHYDEALFGVLEPGDIEEALSAANAVGDDMLQKRATGQVMPDAFTHGTAEQRMYWFKKGYTTGDLDQGDTFSSR